MDKAKAAVSDFMHKAGHHDTTVHEKVAPAVVQENVTKHRHEEATTAIDREIHQDHYHTSVQPIKDREVLPEQHQHNMIPVEEREHVHGDARAIEGRLEQERAQFHDTRTERMKESHSVAPVIAGEHIHHHVHETIQPVVQKETIQPSVIHTTVPIHEVHHNEPKHHAASALPAVSMADFKKQGGSLTGREERYDGFEGEPRAVGSALGTGSTGTTGLTDSTTTGTGGHHHSSKRGDLGTDDFGTTGGLTDGRSATGPSTHIKRGEQLPLGTDVGAGAGAGSTGLNDGTTSNSRNNPLSSSSKRGNDLDPRVDSSYDPNFAATAPSNERPSYETGGAASTTAKKPNLLDRMNPMKDTDRDGKKGFMD